MFITMNKIDKPQKSIISDQSLLKAWVLYQLNIRGKSFASIARAKKVSRQCPAHAFKRTYPHMEKAIADAIGLNPKDLWPDRYDAKGTALYRMGRPAKKSIVMSSNNSSNARAGNPRKSKVA